MGILLVLFSACAIAPQYSNLEADRSRSKIDNKCKCNLLVIKKFGPVVIVAARMVLFSFLDLQIEFYFAVSRRKLSFCPEEGPCPLWNFLSNY